MLYNLLINHRLSFNLPSVIGPVPFSIKILRKGGPDNRKSQLSNCLSCYKFCFITWIIIRIRWFAIPGLIVSSHFRTAVYNDAYMLVWYCVLLKESAGLDWSLFFKWVVVMFCGKGNGTPLQYSCLENPMDGGAWQVQSMGSLSRTQLSDFPFTFHFHALEKEIATHSIILAWRIPGTGEPGGLLSMGLHRVGHDWSDAAAAAAVMFCIPNRRACVSISEQE